MLKIKSVLLVLIISVFFSTVLFADYKENMKMGNEQYKQGNLEKALEYYNNALEENPNDQLFAFTEKLVKKIEAQKKLQGGKDSSGLILIGVDVVLTGLAVVTFMDYSASSDNYEKLYTALNETTEANYNILEYEKKQTEQKGILMAFACGAAGLALTYTVLDMFVFHNSFNTTVSASINPFSGYAGLNVKWRL